MENMNHTLRAKDACKLLSVSKATFYRMVNNTRNFPKARKLGGCKVWITKELTAWLERQAS